MKFSQNTRVVSPNTINAKYTAVTDPMAYGQNGKEWDAFGSAVGVGLKVAQKEQDDRDAADVLEAKNKIQSALTGAFYGEDGILTNGVGENAKGMTDRATRATEDTFQNVAKNYNPRVQRVLKQNMGDTLLSYQKTAMQQEQNERKKQETADYTNTNADTINKAGQNYMSDEMLNLGIKDIKRNTLAYGRLQGWNGKQYEAMTRDAETKYWGTAISAAIEDNNPTRGQAILSAHSKDMDQQTVISFNHQLNADKNMHMYKNDSKWYINNAKPEDKNPDGTIKASAAKQYLDLWGNQTEDVTITVPGGGNNKEAFFTAISGQESGGDYNAVNPLTGATGKYQIMPENWPSWSKEAGLEGASINDPDAQEKVARFKLGQYFDKYGPEGAMVAWYAGEANAKRWVEGAPDAIGENGHYSWDAPQAGGAPSVRQYVNETLAQYHPGPDIPQERNYTITDLVSDSNLSDLTEKKLRLFSRDYYNEFHELPQVTSMRRHGGGGSWHDSGQAFDISGGAMDDHDNRVKALEIGKKYGLVGLDEYEHPASTTTGPNVHFSDHGDDIPAGAGGPTTRTIKRQKYSEQQKADFQKVLYAQIDEYNNQIKEQRAEQTKADAQTLMGMSATDGLAYVNKIKATGDYTRWNAAEGYLRNIHPEIFAKPTGGGTGSRGTGSRGTGSRGGYTGASGIHYTQNEYMKAKDTYRRWENGSESISQKQADNAAYIVNDIEGTTGDNLDVSEGYTVALDAIHRNNYDYDAAIQDLMDNYNFSYTEAKEYVEGAEE